MTTVTHAKVTAKSDTGDSSIVQPSDWNADHIVTGAGSTRYLAGLPSGTLSRSYTWTSTVESWTTSAGTLTSTGGRLQLTHTASAIALEPSGAADIADGEVECNIWNVANAGSNAVLFRAADSTHYYAWIWQTGATYALYKANGGSPSLITTVTPDFRPPIGASWHFMARFVGTQLESYINGSLFGIVIDSTFSTGRIGFRADGNSGTNTLQADDMNIYSTPSTAGNVVVP